MTDQKIASKPLKPSKKHARKAIAARLESALPELRAALGEKKFVSRIKKAAKLLGEDFALLPASADVDKEGSYDEVTKKEKAASAPQKAATATLNPKESKKAKAAAPKQAKKAIAKKTSEPKTPAPAAALPAEVEA